MYYTSHSPGGEQYVPNWQERTESISTKSRYTASESYSYSNTENSYAWASEYGQTIDIESYYVYVKNELSSRIEESVVKETIYSNGRTEKVVTVQINECGSEGVYDEGWAVDIVLGTQSNRQVSEATSYTESLGPGPDAYSTSESYLASVSTNVKYGGAVWGVSRGTHEEPQYEGATNMVPVGDCAWGHVQYSPVDLYGFDTSDFTLSVDYSHSAKSSRQPYTVYGTGTERTTADMAIYVTATTDVTVVHLTATTQSGSSISNVSTYIKHTSNECNISTRSSVGYLPLQYSASDSSYDGTNYCRSQTQSQFDATDVSYSSTTSYLGTSNRGTVVMLMDSDWASVGNSVLWTLSRRTTVGQFSDIFRSVAASRLTLTAALSTSRAPIITVQMPDPEDVTRRVTVTNTYDYGNGLVTDSRGNVYASYKTLQFNAAQSRYISTIITNGYNFGLESATDEVPAYLTSAAQKATLTVTKASSRTATDVGLLALTGSEANLSTTYIISYYKLYTTTQTFTIIGGVELVSSSGHTVAGFNFTAYQPGYSYEKVGESKIYPQEDFRIINKVFNQGYAGFGGSWKDNSKLSIYRSVSFQKLTGDLPDGWAELSSTDLCSASAFSGATFFPTVDTITGRKFTLSYHTVSSMSSQVTISMLFVTTSSTSGFGVSTWVTNRTNTVNGLLTHRAGSDLTVGVTSTSQSYPYRGWSSTTTSTVKHVTSTVKYRAELESRIDKDYYAVGSVFTTGAYEHPVALAPVTYGRAGELSPDDSTMFFPPCVLHYSRTDYSGTALQTFESTTTLSKSNEVLSLTFPKSNNIYFECHPLFSVYSTSVVGARLIETPKYVFDHTS